MEEQQEKMQGKKQDKKLWKIFWSTFYLSAFTFGGGYVIVSLMKKKFVDEYHWIEEEEMLDLVFTQISDMLHSIWQYYHAPNYRHIQLALDYIAENFSDPNLSLESVSSHIGINATYLFTYLQEYPGTEFPVLRE